MTGGDLAPKWFQGNTVCILVRGYAFSACI